MLRVLHTESSEGWGGQENRTFREMHYLREHGHAVAVAAPPTSQMFRRATEAGFVAEPVVMRRSFDLRAVWRLARFMREHRIQVVNTHSSRDTILAGMAARFACGRPLVVRTRHLILPISSLFTYATLPDHVVSVSEAVRQSLIAQGVPAPHLSTVSTGIDFSRFQENLLPAGLHRELGLPADCLLVGLIAVLRAKKGGGDFLSAVPQVLAKHPGARFVIVGDGPQEAKLRQRVQDSDLNGRVFLLGRRVDIPNILAELDLFVLPTHEEALGTAYLEAQAMRVPVIGTRVGGVPEALRDGESGLLVPAHDPAALAEAINELLGDPVRRQRMGEVGRQFALTSYGLERMGDEMVALYSRLLEQR